ncbi:diablo IAP-binding mitochondrial protein-like [Menidia menidia]
MQAVRQCTVCARRAAGGLKHNQADSSVLRRKEAVCVRFLSTSDSRRPGVLKSGDLAKPSHLSLASLSIGHGLWQVEDLSHKSLIRRAAAVVTDSSSTFLSQATLALAEALTDYSKAVHSRIAFQQQYLATLGKLSPTEEESLQQAIGGWRAEAAERLAECKRYESLWVNAIDLCKMAAEAACNTGAEQANISIKTSIQLAQAQVKEAKKMSAAAEKKLAETKVDEIQRMAEYAAFLEDSDEHEVHEAYLRED